MQFLGAFFSVCGLGIIYFVGAIPAGLLLKLPLPVAAFASWLGYTAGSVIIALAGEPLQRWFMKKFRIDPDKPSMVMKAWKSYGLPALGLLAPITIGSPTATVLGLALGVPRWRLVLAISLGLIPYVIGYVLAISLGFHFTKHS